MRNWTLFIAVLLLIPPVSAQALETRSDQEFAHGVERQQAGDLAGARLSYEAALKLSPRRIDALSNLGLVYGGLHQYDRAVGAFTKALAIDPKQPTVLFNLGITYLQAGQNEKARSTLSALVALQGDNYMARQFLAVSLLKLGRMEEGLAEMEGVVSVHPEIVDAAYTLASAYIRNKDLGKARRLIDKVISHHETAEAHLIAGSYYMAEKNYRQAMDELRRAQQLNPALPELGASLGGAYAMTGSQDMAAELFERHLQRNPDDFDSLAFLGWLDLEAERVDEAEKLLSRAHKIRPDDLEVQFQLARIARARKRFPEAVELLERIITVQPQHTRAHVLLAQTYFHLKRTADGNREREIVRRLNEKEQENHNKDIEHTSPPHH